MTPSDFLPQLRATLSHKGDLYSVPFYGESSFLMYRKDLMAKAGIRVPARPTWDQVGKIAAETEQCQERDRSASACAVTRAGGRTWRRSTR